MSNFRPFIYLLVLCFSFFPGFGQIEVPATLEYCGVEIQFTPEAQAVVQEYVDKMHQHPMYFEQMVKRARTYMPFIEEAFREARVPEDLKYICIQESGMQANAISKSNAVGFWQFKEEVGRSVGLIINDKVDERRHIYRASQAAAVYFTQTYTDFANWVYAIIAYYEGPTGAVKHTDPQYYGENKMIVNKDLHWYALKAIAHKLAYEEALSTYDVPDIFLTPYLSEGETSLKELAEQHSLSTQLFLEYNAWILDNRKLPKNITFTYYVPRPGEYYTAHKEDPMKEYEGDMATKSSYGDVSGEEELPVVYTDISILGEGRESEENIDDSVADPTPVSDVLPAATNAAEEPVSKDIFDSPVANSGSEKNTSEPIPAEGDTSLEAEMPPFAFAEVNAGMSMQEAALIASEVLDRSEYAEFYLKDDLHYGTSYLLFEGNMTVEEIAAINRLKAEKLLKWNGIYGTSSVEIGAILYMLPPGQRAFHIVESGESLAHIATRLDCSIKKLVSKTD